MSSFAMEFELIVGNQEINFLEKRFNTGSNIYNLCLRHCIKHLNRLKKDKKYRKFVKTLKAVNRKLEKKNLPQDEIKRLKETKTSFINKIKKLEKEYKKRYGHGIITKIIALILILAMLIPTVIGIIPYLIR